MILRSFADRECYDREKFIQNHKNNEAIGGSSNGGVDGIISEDPLGLDNIYIQAKHWESLILEAKF